MLSSTMQTLYTSVSAAAKQLLHTMTPQEMVRR